MLPLSLTLLELLSFIDLLALVLFPILDHPVVVRLLIELVFNFSKALVLNLVKLLTALLKHGVLLLAHVAQPVYVHFVLVLEVLTLLSQLLLLLR